LDELATSSVLAVEIHRQFYERLPESLRFVDDLEVATARFRGEIGAHGAFDIHRKGVVASIRLE
jgi:hypothetical protein